MEPNTCPALRRECSCGCEYITIILHKPGFVDAEPVCPVCKGATIAAGVTVVCEHAGHKNCDPACHHISTHVYESEFCDETAPCSAGFAARCIPVADGKEG